MQTRKFPFAKPIEGLTEEKDAKPKRLGSKRVTRILKAFGLIDVYTDKKKNKDERKNLRFMITNFAPKREVTTKNGKTYIKRSKIKRLTTPDRLRRNRLLKKFHLERREKAKKDVEAYIKNYIKRLLKKKKEKLKKPKKQKNLKRKKINNH